ncbi:hypothetical protein PVK06_038970 [Gossypium arboreum]|uniref:CCHC-type domain-containing protein n=1 Tax=Gossypium arboreum TaxID=29729 RepID=A0ABR0N1V1_GOSAR|nr:hypothetical protein PVK06_038970 [Gossypium arboreum]
MNSEESIKDMSNIFPNIINGLKALGMTYPNKEMMKKLLNSLLKEWEAKVTVIEEYKDFDKLIGSLLTYEMKLKIGMKKPRQVGVAIKSSIQEESTDDEDEDNEEVIILAKKFKRFIKMGKDKLKEKKIVCYICKKSGHNKYNCPLNKKQKGKKKAMVST